MTFADRVIRFYEEVDYPDITLPHDVRIINPFRQNPEVMKIVREFYSRYYNDRHKRHLILGINPGRFGGGNTGIPFTDPKRLQSVCNITFNGKITHEPSSVFVYEVINALGGPAAFYARYYISSLFPLALITIDKNGKEKNYNYYDRKDLQEATMPYILQNIRDQISLGIKTDVCFCLGTGKNAQILSAINAKHKFFGEIIPLEHPRFVMQYKSRSMAAYINKYVQSLTSLAKL